jgi:hypothetical protein
MLIRVAPRFFQASTGDTVTIAAVARNNNGFEGATYQYAGVVLTGTQVQGHPACQFTIAHGVDTLTALLLFDPTAPAAVYDVFEVDAAGNFLPLVDAPASAGRLTQFQIDGLPVASPAAARLGAAARARVGAAQPMAANAAVNVPPPPAAPRATRKRAARKPAAAKTTATSRRARGAGK